MCQMCGTSVAGDGSSRTHEETRRARSRCLHKRSRVLRGSSCLRDDPLLAGVTAGITGDHEATKRHEAHEATVFIEMSCCSGSSCLRDDLALQHFPDCLHTENNG